MEFNFENPGGNNSASPKESKQNSSKKIIILIAVLALIIGVGVYFFLTSGNSNSNSEIATNGSVITNNSTGGNPANTAVSALGSDQDRISGITVGGLFIPDGLDEKAIKFLQQLKSQGQFPVVVDESTLGRVNPF
ncbi:MAG: hypothetical protein U9Q72_01185 [Patescibacteria group bacterium]|nr:hypothetical protein [Patescibacteria group bacterium]